MADISIKYKGETIASIDESGIITLKTQGKYCEGDITLEYEKSGGTGVELNVNINGVYIPTAPEMYNKVTVAVPYTTYYVGTVDPPSSFGQDGDIYFKEA